MSSVTPLRIVPASPVGPSSTFGAAHAQHPYDLLGTAIEQLPHGLSLFDADDRLVLANRRFGEIWALPERLTHAGTHFADIIAATQGRETPPTSPEDAPPIDPKRAGRRRREWRMHDGRIIEVTVTRMEGGACVALHEDVTEKRRTLAHIDFLARNDVLTQLPNRTQLGEALAQQLPRTHRGEELALLCLDLDHFKAVNDTLGHAAGDELLQHVARRLRQCAREGDLVARLAGDEFALLQVGARQPAGATALGRRIIEALAEPFDVGGHQVHIGTSVGVAIAPYDGDDAETLLKRADLALYRAKDEGRQLLRYFEPEMDARMQARRQLEGDLRNAIARQEFELHYQPLVSMATFEVRSVEALLRWNHPTRGRVSPADFIPLAEDSALIIPIGQWVLQQACRDAATWPDHVGIAVNVSPVQFKSRSLVSDVLQALQASGLPASRLELEITEAVLLQDTEHALAVLHELRRRGIRIAMDDFGTGYSSLSYLRRFPFDKIKIDRSFIPRQGDGDEGMAIVRAVTGLGRSLGMVTTVEGVETLDQLHALRAEGCTDAQGYLFSPPRPARELPALFAGGTRPATVE